MLFDGIIACFSPSVDASLRSAWVKHGGSLTVSKQEFYQTNVFFCDGPYDPWLKQSLVVRHAQWISKSVSEQFSVPVAKYLLDDQFDPTKIASARQIPNNSLKQARKPPTPHQPLVCHEEPPEIAAKPNTLKRAFDSENHDESSTEIDLRPLKRARTRPVPSPQFVATSGVHTPAPAIFPTRAARTSIFYPSPANSSPLKTLNYPKPAPRAAKPLRRIDFTALKPTPTMPALSFPRPRPTRRSTAADPRTNPSNDIPDSAFVANDPPRTTIAEILSAPRSAAYRFLVSETYQEKVFLCSKLHCQPSI
ncbi:hypothetical protein DFH08DRAFT_955188 [Mycena albidolilacea]|uniref:BRCT domain-containing protein n=1 Tax=Mycena albidolilacea TaxID=1033008 RepID=A0AAD7ADE6_9AGAR|nr:hypothetical protein DFH08DRAFT_955188 [Mycena albidolilacea]